MIQEVCLLSIRTHLEVKRDGLWDGYLSLTEGILCKVGGSP